MCGITKKIFILLLIGVNCLCFSEVLAVDNKIQNRIVDTKNEENEKTIQNTNNVKDKEKNNTINDKSNSKVSTTNNSGNTSKEKEKKENEHYKIRYETHIQNIGWQDWKKDEEVAGTTGKSLRLESIKIETNSDINAKIRYKVHVQNMGWQDWKKSGELAGTTGQGKRLEALKIELEKSDDYVVQYRVHVQNMGWQEWKEEGELAGTTGKSLRLEAIQIRIVNKNKKVRICIDSPKTKVNINSPRNLEVLGWKMSNVYNDKILVYLDNSNKALDNKVISYHKRNDVLELVRGYGNENENRLPGFKVTIPTDKLSIGEHSLKIKVMLSNNILKEETVNFNVTRNVGISYNSHIQNIGWQGYVGSGEISGTEGKSLRVEAIKLQLENISNINVKYQVHVQNIGWQNWKQNGEIAGTEGKSLRIEAIRIRLEYSDEYVLQYRVHVQNIGWQEWKQEGEIAGTEGKSLRVEAIQIRIIPKEKKARICIDTPKNTVSIDNTETLQISGWKMSNVYNDDFNIYLDNKLISKDNYSIEYRKRSDVIELVKNYGNEYENPMPGFLIKLSMANIDNGEHILILKDMKSDRCLAEAKISFILKKKMDVIYRSHVQDIGWQNYVKNGSVSGTSGKSLRIEALNIKLDNAPTNSNILYQAHIQSIGWQEWKKNGETAGTEKKGLRIEAIKIKLQNIEEYTVEYRVHIQDIGWTDWCIDGEVAGTTGQGKRLEAIQIRIVRKYKRRYKGIDVSQYQNNINWRLVKGDGIDFAFIRVGYRGYGQAGKFREDTMFRMNLYACRNANIKTGAYFVTQAITEAESVEEANWVIERVKGYRLDYPIALDIEAPGKESPNDVGRAEYLDIQTRTRLAKIFCQTIENAGYKAMIYTNLNWAQNCLDMSELNDYDTWIAQYNNKSNTDYNGNYTIWQYTSKGRINGISGNVDMNIGYKKY